MWDGGIAASPGFKFWHAAQVASSGADVAEVAAKDGKGRRAW